ncbi:MAG TPA: hypothetical protein VJ792_04940 [Candidatus Nitrosotalea sp.]|nr:hypothetical protein [Candidatus Nitrosotalea sp.]
MIEEILERIGSTGVQGVKKADLKKEFGKESDGILEKLAKGEKVFIEKKGVAYYVWTRENYIIHLTENDPKFKLVLNMLVGVSHSVARLKDHTQNLREEMERISLQDEPSRGADFENAFDKCLREAGTSIGWTPFSKVREKICQSHDISREKFYTLAGDLVEKHHDKYEVSTGGQEGIVIRGMVHGFVRTV